jgi:hypothetical protein
MWLGAEHKLKRLIAQPSSNIAAFETFTPQNTNLEQLERSEVSLIES